jgi:uncharacterized protein
MRIDLDKRPERPRIIVGFPGVGLVGPIVTEFLIEHMKTEQIGKFIYDELPPTAAIHKGKLVHPMSVHYSPQQNTIIVYTILNLKKHEWDVAHAIAEIARELSATEILCIDGANAAGEEGPQLYFFGDERLGEGGAKRMDESVIMGVSGALLLTAANVNCIFASTQLEMPDSKAAAEIVKFLDKHLGLQVDYQPLLEQARAFEEKLKGVLSQSQKAMTEQDRKSMDYLG